MRKIFFSLFAILTSFSLSSYSQDQVPDFGKIDIADLKMTECPFDKSADAMNLIKTENVTIGTATFTYNIEETTNFRRRIKIFSEKGFSQANISIPYFSQNGSVKIEDIEAVICTLDDKGKVSVKKLEKSQIFNDHVNAKTSLNKLIFTFPNLKTGSVIEYRYTKVDKKPYVVEPWPLQDNIPTQYSAFYLTIPSWIMSVELHIVTSLPMEKDSFYTTSDDPLHNKESRSIVVRNIPKFRMEPFMSSVVDNLQRIEVSIKGKIPGLPDRIIGLTKKPTPELKWKYYNSSLLESPFFGKQFTQPIDEANTFIDSLKAVTDTLEKIKTIYAYVKKNIHWNGEQTYYSNDLADCWKNKTGSSATINISLLNLLRKSGITCYPILISTRQHGKPDKDFPNMGQFNGVDVIVVQDSVAYILDCVQKYSSFKTPPFNILNRDVYLIDPYKNTWLNIASSGALMTEDTKINAEMDGEGKVQATAEVIYTGLAKEDELTEEDDIKKGNSRKSMIAYDEPDLVIDSSSQERENDNTDTLIRKAQFHYTLSNTGDIYFFNSLALFMFRKNVFADSIRSTDIDFGSNQAYTTSIAMKVPQNFNIEELPENKQVIMPDSGMVFKCEYYKGANIINMQVTFQINKAIFSKEEYPGLKAFYNKVYALLNDQILLKRKG